MSKHYDTLETRSPAEREKALMQALPQQVANAKANEKAEQAGKSFDKVTQAAATGKSASHAPAPSANREVCARSAGLAGNPRVMGALSPLPELTHRL